MQYIIYSNSQDHFRFKKRLNNIYYAAKSKICLQYNSNKKKMPSKIRIQRGSRSDI